MKHTPVIISILSGLPNNLCRVRFLAIDGFGTILKSFTCKGCRTRQTVTWLKNKKVVEWVCTFCKIINTIKL